MSKSKLTLIVDGNWLLMSRLAILNNKFADKSQVCHELKLMMIKSMNVVLRQFPIIDNIIFVADGGSWRNHLEVPNFLVSSKYDPEVIDEIKSILKDYIKKHYSYIDIDIDALNADNFTLDYLNELIRKLDIDGIDLLKLPLDKIEYKGNRTPDPNIDWDMIFASYEDFIATLNASGVTAVKEPGIEGDDWAWYWAQKLNSEGTNVIIWTKDKDLTQLVKIDKNKCFTVWWNKDSGLIAPEFKDEELDFLFNSELNENEDLYNAIIAKSKEVVNINPKTVILDKIIRGDSGDNILPVVQRKSKTESNMRLYKVSVKDINFNLDFHNEDEVREYFTVLLSSKNYLGRVTRTVNQVVEHFMYNVKLVTLEKESYPEYILDIFKNYTEYNCSRDISKAESQISAEANTIQNILDII